MRQALILAALIALAPLPALAQAPAKPAPAAFEKTQHKLADGKSDATFSALWQGKELKMIQEELVVGDASIKREYTFRDGVLLHYKLDLAPLPNSKAETMSIMATFDKSGKAVMSTKRMGGKQAPAGPEEIAAAKARAADLAARAMKERG